ncbi:terminase small subunit [Thalassotalea nanhaiensis]|uniref:Terminase small subunit n=1 Tax=Thalassotalea nanhaiensis TaxID=3065648 RepID=A0ABY9TM73_9GAMM|nr:terminase small subunit [Colwelliaceae bacterium SQ345]
MKELTTKQQRFVDEFLIDYSATKAAIRAGYSTNCAGVIGCENLKKPIIKKAIKEQLKLLTENSFLNREMVLAGLLREAVDRSDKSSAASRVSAYDKLGKALGIYQDAKPSDEVGDLIRSITANNAKNRKSLLPKDNIDMSKLE